MKKICLLALLCGTIATTPAITHAENSTEELEAQLQRIFDNNPELIINVLRQNSEAVLDIATEGSNQKRERALIAQWEQDMATEKNIRTEGRTIWGNPDAPITIYEFSDFTCPYCADGAITLKELLPMYGDQVRLIFKHTPLSNNPTAILASEYVIAAGFQSPELALQLYNNVFMRREALLAEGEDFLKAEADRIGLNVEQLQEDAKSERTHNIMLEDLEDARSLAVEGTPYFFVNNLVIRGAVSQELFKQAIDMVMADS